ncbi:hypothetical protein F5Y17DRAFT_203729 [Xylariaceae sp. FL0594]|nr:hypothetical protein F5Y17DRAFT_203729 [Xylariaceae sp. FL0594]
MSISLRESIQWLPDDASPSEPTSTIVLTSPGCRFVDIRVLKQQHQPSHTHTPSAALDWAFAGFSTSTPLPGGGRHSTWRHVIDSRHPFPVDVVDKGDIYPLPFPSPHPPLPQTDDDGNGSVERTLEKGRMLNPATGKVTAYEEVWLDYDTSTSISIPKPQTHTHRIIVLELGTPPHARGMLICLGGYCQSVLRSSTGEEGNSSSSSSSSSSTFAAERWVFAEEDAAEEEEEGKGKDNNGNGNRKKWNWKLEFRVGPNDIRLPDPETLFRRHGLALGQEIVVGSSEEEEEEEEGPNVTTTSINGIKKGSSAKQVWTVVELEQ